MPGCLPILEAGGIGNEVNRVNWIDISIAALMLLGFLHGLMKGVIQEVFAILALVVGLVAAGHVSAGTEPITEKLSHPTAAKVLVFILTFFVVALIVGLIGKLLSGLAKAANLKTIDRLIGGVVGACLVGLIVGAFFMVGESFGMDITFLEDSVLARQLMAAVAYLGAFLPQASDTIGA
jgi:membrane protein required for colicin V production